MTSDRPITYVALGDSYTIGEGVPADERWPDRLVHHLRDDGIEIDLVANPSVTGWTTAQVLDHELLVFDAARATFATLLIGVNDWVQGVPAGTFAGNLDRIIAHVRRRLPDPSRLVLITIPDFSVTPAGGDYARGRDITAGIVSFNEIILGAADRERLPVVDIFPLSRQHTAPEDVAADGLHPSGVAYARWEALIFPVVRGLLMARLG